MKLKCCICSTDKYDKFFKKINDFELVRCAGCGLVYLKDAEEKFDFIQAAQSQIKINSSQKVQYWSFPCFYDKYKPVFDGFFTERLLRIKQICPGARTMFDVGCGYGLWMKFCAGQGIEVKGIDLSCEVVNYARGQLHLDAEIASLEDYRFDRQYDVMVMCDILEHLFEPNKQLEKIRNNLQRGGIIFIQVPNLLGFKIPLRHSFSLPYHLWQFSLETISLLLKKNGFKIAGYWTGVMGIIGEYEKGWPRLFQRALWKSASLLRLGNRLKVIAKKI